MVLAGGRGGGGGERPILLVMVLAVGGWVYRTCWSLFLVNVALISTVVSLIIIIIMPVHL